MENTATPQPPTAAQFAAVNRRLDIIIELLGVIMTEQQTDVDAVTAQIQSTDADVQALTTQVSAAQAAFDTAIANLEAQIANGQPADLTQLKAAAAVLAGDQPNLDAAVAALAADPNAAPPAPPAP